MKIFSLRVPQPDNTQDITLDSGNVLFVVGANGTGKSALLQHLYSAHKDSACRIAANRQTWFESDAIQFSPQQILQIGEQLNNLDSQYEARWKNQRAEARTSITIHDLLSAENEIARQIASAVRAGDMDDAQIIASGDSPIEAINRILSLSNIQVNISIQENDRIFASKNNSTRYSIAELSDGERNALLIAAQVLTAPKDTLLVIDEPERHLHRSIISPLLQNLVAERLDCAFVISTHELTIPFDFVDSRILLLRGCMFQDKRPSVWDTDLIDNALDIDEQLKLDILGSRRRILFVEGVSASLDKPLYSLLFPDLSVIPKANCRAVETAVRGVNDASDFQWIEGYGIVDGDARGEAEKEALKGDLIIPLDMYSVESLYYDPEVIRIVSLFISAVDGGNGNARCEEAIAEAISLVAEHADRLAQRRIEKRIREEHFRQIPSNADIESGGVYQTEINIDPLVENERAKIQEAISNQDYRFLVQSYPLRETPAFNRIAKTIGLQGCLQYHRTVLKLVNDNADLKSLLYNLLEDFCGVIGDSLTSAEQVAAPDRYSAALHSGR